MHGWRAVGGETKEKDFVRILKVCHQTKSLKQLLVFKRGWMDHNIESMTGRQHKQRLVLGCRKVQVSIHLLISATIMHSLTNIQLVSLPGYVFGRVFPVTFPSDLHVPCISGKNFPGIGSLPPLVIPARNCTIYFETQNSVDFCMQNFARDTSMRMLYNDWVLAYNYRVRGKSSPICRTLACTFFPSPFSKQLAHNSIFG